MAKEQFITRHIGPRPEDVEDMLKVIGVQSVDELIEQTVPASIRLKETLDLPAPLSEDEFLEKVKSVAAKNKLFRSFIGQGYYDTISPAVIVRNILENPGLVYFLYSLSGRSIAGTFGSFTELSDYGAGIDGDGDYKLFFIG